MELRRYVEVLRKRATIIGVCVVLAIGGVVAQVAMRPPIYQAEVTMLVMPQQIGLDSTTPDMAAMQSSYRDAIFANIIFLMKSRTLMQRAGQRLGMDAWDVEKRVAAAAINGTNVLTVSAKDGDPERAALIANTVTQEFRDYYSQVNSSQASSARKFIEDQLSRTKESLDQAEGDLLAFKTRTGAVALSDQISRTVNRTLDLQAQYDAAAMEQQAAQARMEAIQSRLRTQSGQFAQLSVETNPVFSKLRDDLTNLEVELAGLRQTYTDQHPKVQAELGKIAALKQQMNAEAARAASGESLGVSPVREQMIQQLITSQVDAVAARARAAAMSQVLSKLQANLNTLPANELQLARLQRAVKVHEDTYMRLSSLYEDALIKERNAASSGQAAVIIVDPAEVPGSALPKRLPFTAAFAGLVGLVVGCAIALLIEGLDDRVSSANETESVYGVPVLSSIPVMDPRSHRHLSGAPALTTVSLPIVVACLLGLTAAVLSLMLIHHVGASDQAASFGRLFGVFQAVR
jgi:uncharacterized protein involved in exopolysaccharide biosynthesis